MKIRTSFRCADFSYNGEIMNTDNISLKDGERLDKINESLSLIQKSDGLVFGTDAYLLAAFVNSRSGVGADLGAGTGVASLLCAARGKASKIYAAELQDDFYDLCLRNAELNSLSDRVIPLHCDIRELSVKDTERELDFVISNPPYMSAGSGRGNASDAKNAARRELNGSIYDFCAAAARLLRFGGSFYTVYRPDRLADLIFALKKCSLEPKELVTVYPREDSPPCLVLVKSKKGAGVGLVTAPPLIIYRNTQIAPICTSSGETDLGYTQPFTEIYESFSLAHLFKRKA